MNNQHVYNLVAKMIREEYAVTSGMDGRRALERLALRFASRFNEDNREALPRVFNAIDFLDRCAPDPDLVPLSELWEETWK